MLHLSELGWGVGAVWAWGVVGAMPRKHNWWLMGISVFTALLFGVQALIAYRAFVFRQDNYYLVSLFIFGALALFSVFTVIQGWRNMLPGQNREERPQPESETPTGEA